MTIVTAPECRMNMLLTVRVQADEHWQIKEAKRPCLVESLKGFPMTETKLIPEMVMHAEVEKRRTYIEVQTK